MWLCLYVNLLTNFWWLHRLKGEECSGYFTVHKTQIYDNVRSHANILYLKNNDWSCQEYACINVPFFIINLITIIEFDSFRNMCNMNGHLAYFCIISIMSKKKEHLKYGNKSLSLSEVIILPDKN